MAKVRVKIIPKPKKSGVKLASATVRVAPIARPTGKPIYQTTAQIHAKIYTTSSGQPRRY